MNAIQTQEMTIWNSGTQERHLGTQNHEGPFDASHEFLSSRFSSPRLGRKQGFTLVEMLLVLVILATLAALVLPKFAGRTEQARLTAAKTDISSICAALDAFEVDNGYYPKNGSLNALVEQPSDATSWRGPYLSKGVPLDPWGNAYVYDYPGKHNANGFDVSSAGPDGRPGTDDDVTNWDANKK